MRFAFVCALAACTLTACGYDYDALMGSGVGGASGHPGAAGDIGTGRGGAGGVGGAGAGGRGGDGSGGVLGEGGRGGVGGALGEGARGGIGGAAGRGGAGGVGGTAGTGTGGSVGGAVGRGGTGGVGGSVGGRGGEGGSGAAGARGGAGGVGGAAGRGGTSGAGGGGGTAGGAGGRGGGGATGGTGGGADPDLVLWYKFDEGSGTVALDSSTFAGAPRNGTLLTAGTGGAVSFSAMHQVGTHAVSLTANGVTGGGYVAVPSLSGLAPGAMTISIWVLVSSNQRWQRILDIGNSTTDNIVITTQSNTDAVRFGIRTATTLQEINSALILPLATWHHIVVVLPAGAPYTGELYIDSVLVAANPAMTLHTSDLGATVNNFLGKSQFATDPYFSGLIDDFRVYRRALTREQIGALYNAR